MFNVADLELQDGGSNIAGRTTTTLAGEGHSLSVDIEAYSGDVDVLTSGAWNFSNAQAINTFEVGDQQRTGQVIKKSEQTDWDQP
jgi:hypothetical protein